MTGDEFSEIDRRLREAYSEEPVETAGARIGIQKEMGRLARRQWMRHLAVAAVVCAVALAGYWVVRQKRAAAALFSEAARDHRIEVVQKAPRRWRTSDSDVDSLTAKFGVSRGRMAFQGYRLLRAKVCLLDGRRVLHLVYSDSASEYSLYLLPGGSAVPATERQEGSEHVAGIHASRIEGLVVGEGAAPDCRRFVRTVTGV